jgi:hypothetical protein
MPQGEFEVVQPAARVFPRDDVDRASDGPRARLRRGSPQNFDALHLLGIERVQGQPRLHPFSVDEDLGVPPAEPAHTHLVAALHGHTGQTLENVPQRGAAKAFDFLSSDHDFAGG